MKNKIEDLRNHLFAQLEKLQDEDSVLETEVQRSTAMVGIAKVIVDSARAENEFLQITQGDGSGFIPYHKDERKELPKGKEKK